MLHNVDVNGLRSPMVAFVALCLVALSCSSGDVSSSAQNAPTETSSGSSDNSVSTIASTTSSVIAVPSTTTAASDVPVLVVSTDLTLSLDHTVNAPSSDAFAPSVMPDAPMGRVGYTRYVFARSGDQIIPALVEGPEEAKRVAKKLNCRVHLVIWNSC